MSFWQPQPRQPFVGLAIAAVIGIFAADFREISPLCAFGFTAVGVLAVLIRPVPLTCWLLCAATFFELHSLRHYGSEARRFAASLAPGPRVVHVTGVVWSEPEKPTSESRTTTARFVMKADSFAPADAAPAETIPASVAWAGAMPAYGDRVSLIASAVNIENPRNPGQFDFADYQRRRGIYTELRARYAADCVIESHGHGQPAQVLAFRTSAWIQRQLRVDLEDSPEISELITGMVLGLQSETPEDLKVLFQRTGTMHLLAVSGLHVGMLAAILLGLLRLIRVPRRAAALILIPLLAGYTLVTGLPPSGVRSALMLSAVLIGYIVDRRPLALNNLGAAALAIFLWDDEQLFSAGFQFSFVLVVVIVLFAMRIQRRLARFGQPDSFLPRDLWTMAQRTRVSIIGNFAGALGISIAAWIGSLAFTIGYFHLFSPSTVLANFFVVPLSFLVLILGLGAILCAPLWNAGVILCNNANWFVVKLLLEVLKLFTQLPGSFVYVELPRPPPRPACEFTVFDFGEGSATHLRASGSDWLLDCGGGHDFDRVLLPYLRSRGVNRLDGLLLTHGDVRHIGGAMSTIADFAPEQIVESALRDRSPTRRGLHQELDRHGQPKSIYVRGDRIHIDSQTTLRVLYPPAGLRRSVADDMALVLQLEAGGRRVLFMSDSGFTTERWLLENEPDLRSDVLVKGQHTRDFSGTPDFLARVDPEAAVCGALGFGQSPAKLDPWVREVSARGMAVFRQDESGAVQVEIREGSIELRGFLNGQTFRSRAR